MKKAASKSLIAVEKGSGRLSEEEVMQLIAYVKGIGQQEPPSRRLSQQDAKIQKLELMADAFRKTIYGRRYATARETYDLASGIEILRTIAVSPAASAYRRFEHQDLHLRAWAAKSLLDFAIGSTRKLRQVADALDAVEAEKRQDPRQFNILNAYSTCDNYPPTFAELRKTFVAKFGSRSWTRDYSVRKTLKWLGLPLAKGKRPGRPRGSRSKIGNPRRVEQ
jgi:hypothetical protein